MPTIKEMKVQLKELAKDIRAAKADFKSRQRALSTYDRENPEWSKEWRSEAYKARWALVPSWYPKHWAMAVDYRYLHVTYCMACGRKYEQIEPKVREGNEIDMKRVEKMLAEVVYEQKTDDRCAG